ncbi:hypothetical protein Nepgr_033519 [Nepenthes gracilis]|uniref:Uncharacterized protein n=1 Tax=Nepenthes gracilis TaxID=150966 RepID=A0AAD3TLB8_NEPGR|nr:hypothetical protein Nepgr_033519 [Nepenthes gracilis]
MPASMCILHPRANTQQKALASLPAVASSKPLNSSSHSLQQWSSEFVVYAIKPAPSANNPAPHQQLNILTPITALQHQPTAGTWHMPFFKQQNESSSKKKPSRSEKMVPRLRPGLTQLARDSICA